MNEAARAIMMLLDQRGAEKTICPSEAARTLAGPQGDWRTHMIAVHTAVDALLMQGAITLSWQGIPKNERRGPYRIARRTCQP